MELQSIQIAHDASCIVIMDTQAMPGTPMPPPDFVSHMIWFSLSDVQTMLATASSALPDWLKRFLARQANYSLYPYKTEGVGTLFFGRVEELKRLISGDRRGGIIIGAHRSGKYILLHKLAPELSQRGQIIVGPVTPSGVRDFKEFFDLTLTPLGIKFSQAMTPATWAAKIRQYSRECGKRPAFLLDEVDGLLALDLATDSTLGQQMRSLQLDGHADFYLAGHGGLREAIAREEGPFRNFARRNHSNRVGGTGGHSLDSGSHAKFGTLY